MAMTERKLLESVVQRLDKMVCKSCRPVRANSNDHIYERTMHSTCKKIAALRDSVRREMLELTA